MTTSSKPVALVTGGSRGIGLGIAEQLADHGFNLAINGRRPADAVTDVLPGLQQRGSKVIYCAADVAQARDRSQLVQTALEAFGRLDVLVNNAGVAPEERADILEATDASFQRLIQINLQGPYFLTQLAARQMIAQSKAGKSPPGIIVNVSSISATVASVNRGDYCISKAGVSMMTKLWAARLAEFGIQVYEVRPGIIRTDMTTPVAAKYGQLLANGLTLERRWGTPHDVGRAVAMLARGELPYATGNVITVDGGLSLPRL